jgi:phage gp36-like protein
MPYATQQDLIDRFGEQEIVQLTDRDGPPTGAINDTIVGKALADSDELINGYLAGRYQVPVAAPVPAVLSQLACDIARYKLHLNEPPELVRKNYEDALKRLKEISDGTFVLQVAGAEAAEIDPPATGVDFAGADRVFSNDNLRGF